MNNGPHSGLLAVLIAIENEHDPFADKEPFLCFGCPHSDNPENIVKAGIERLDRIENAFGDKEYIEFPWDSIELDAGEAPGKLRVRFALRLFIPR